MSSSDRSSSPDEDAAAAAAPAEETPATVTPAAKRKRKAKATASASRDLIVECLRVGLGVILDKKQVDVACKAILASSTVQELVLKLEAQQAGGKRRKGNGTDKPKGRIISAYGMFVTLVYHALKAAGISNVVLPDVGSIWQALPEEMRADISVRFNAIKGSYNAAVAAGENPSLTDALAAHAEEARLQPIDYMAIYKRYKDSAKAAAAAAAAGGGKPKAKAKPGKKAVAAAAAPAAAAAAPAPAAAAAPTATEEKHKKHKKEKQKDKKNKAEAEAAPTTEKKKHKKHKHEKVKQQESD